MRDPQVSAPLCSVCGQSRERCCAWPVWLLHEGERAGRLTAERERDAALGALRLVGCRRPWLYHGDEADEPTCATLTGRPRERWCVICRALAGATPEAPALSRDEDVARLEAARYLIWKDVASYGTDHQHDAPYSAEGCAGKPHAPILIVLSESDDYARIPDARLVEAADVRREKGEAAFFEWVRSLKGKPPAPAKEPA